MPGHNHKLNCTCGWCYKQKRRNSIDSFSLPIRSTSTPNARSLNFRKLTYQSFIRPNAVCPHCKKKVFFYRSAFGGRKFFDVLGPPWTKHPCLDTGLLVQKNFVDEKTQWLWQRGGWQPYVCLIVNRKDEATKITGYDALTRKRLILIAYNAPTELLKMPLLIREQPGKADMYDCSCPDGVFQANRLRRQPK